MPHGPWRGVALVASEGTVWIVFLDIVAEGEEAAFGVLSALGATGVSAEGVYPLPPFSLDERPPRERVRVTGYFHPSGRESVLSGLAARLPFLRELDPGLSWGEGTMQEEAWAEAWKAHYHPLEIGPFLVLPSWEAPPPNGERLVLPIDPGSAFGTGQHATTRLLLEAMGAYPFGGRRVIDVGTGSGILAMGAALLGAWEVLALDLDPLAVAAARANTRGWSVIQVREGELEAEGSPADRILCNIVADVILEILPRLRCRLAPGGLLFLGGIIPRYGPEVARALQTQGLPVRRWAFRQGWLAVVAGG